MDDLNSFTYFSETDFGDNGSLNLNTVDIILLPGEQFKQFDLLNYGCRFGLTNYRIMIIFDIIINEKNNEKYNIISIPLGLIYQIEYYGMICVNIITKIGCRFSLTFPDIALCEKTLKKIKEARLCENIFGIEFFRVLKDDFPTHFLINGSYTDNDWNEEIHIIENEFQRLKFPLELWRISDVNKKFRVCSSYPQFHIVLKEFPDNSLKDMAKFRSKNRFISVVYRSVDTGAILLRAGQPLTGVSGWRNRSDEEYFSLISSLMETNIVSHTMIFDARSYTSAQLNKVKGGGIESETYYPSASIEFLNIPNMHTVRSSFESLSSAMSCDNKNFYDLVDKSGWLLLIRDLLKSANSICNIMHSEGKSVLVHCSDGWDRTPQLTSLTMILLDPFYRTIKGFKILIQREWIYFGHRFNERCALLRTESGREFSPIFLQWLDCINQLQLQFVDHFEFNEKFLIKLALHVYSGLFGTFNKSRLYTDEICSLWNFLCNREIRAFLNPFYNPNKTFSIIKPITRMVEMKLWVGLYRDALDPNFRQLHSSKSLNRDLPPELNNLTLMNSIINGKEQEDDYEGEDVELFEKYELPDKKDIDFDEEDVLLEASITKANKGIEKSFFKSYSVKCSLDSIEEICEDNNVYVTRDIDFDGLFIQKDILFNYCEINRQNRHLLKRRNQIYKNELIKMYHMLSKTMEITNLKDDIDETDDDILCDLDQDNITIISDISNLEYIVLWVPDHAVTHCTLCHEEFGVFKRKHHCRNCGKIFCKTCSLHKSKVIKQKIMSPERVCDTCYNDLNKMKLIN